MRVALVNSRQDTAGSNIRRHMERLLSDDAEGRWQEQAKNYCFFTVEERLIHAEDSVQRMDADLIIFLSRHSSVNPVPVLTVHVTGNFGAAALGGTARTLAPAAPVMMQATLRALAAYCPQGYRVSYEVTHHGPTALLIPSFFVEIGSTEKEWSDPVAGEAAARAVLDASPVNAIPLIGFGGTHYAVRETEIALTTRGAFGHIAHTREIAALDDAMIRAMMDRSRARAAYIDHKALERATLSHLEAVLDRLAIPRISEREIAAAGHVSWDTLCAVREMAEQVSTGARWYIHDLQGDGILTRVRINPVLLNETVKSDEGGLMRELDTLPVVHLSTNDNRLLPEFITCEQQSSEIINHLNTLCVKTIRNKEITTTENDYLIITRVRFDPQKAHELGVPPGPSRRNLAEGREVRINGRVITPEMVSLRSEIKIHIPGLEKFHEVNC